jgi:lysophospholipid acyltransferase (LPLAT)-like uncharacterized protein
VILSLWHGQMLPLLCHHRGSGIAVLISEHSDGEIIARIATRMGLRLIRGSSSRGAARALVGLTSTLAQGHDIAVTPDGPRGPYRSVAPGILVASQRSGVPIIPLGVSVSRSWQLGSWDRFTIPWPFARVTIAYGEPMVPDAATAREAAGGGDLLEQAMVRAEADARQGQGRRG